MIKSPVPPVLPVMKKRGLQVHPVHPVRNPSSQLVRMMPPLRVHLHRVIPQQPEELRQVMVSLPLKLGHGKKLGWNSKTGTIT